MPAVDAERRALVLQQALRALVAQHWSEADRTSGTFPGGATLLEGERGWVLVSENPAHALGGALAWSRTKGLRELHVIVDDVAATLARRAGAFAVPPAVWLRNGRELARAEAEPIATPAPVPPEVLALADVIAAAGADAVVEHGVLLAEVLGLEVARVAVTDGAAHLEVGVGKHDREAQRLIHGDRAPVEALGVAVRAVRERRTPGAPAHQINQVAAERWLRAIVVARPELVGAARLERVAPPHPRSDLRQRAVAPAVGEDNDGRPVVVVCSTGIHVDLVPSAADVRLRDRPEARLVLVIPDGDDHPVTRELAAALAEPADVVTVQRDWKALTSLLT